MFHSRRDFMKLTLATSLPLALGVGGKSAHNSLIEGVRLGVQNIGHFSALQALIRWRSSAGTTIASQTCT